MDHIVIRNPEFVAGTKMRPEIGVFVQTHKNHYPINSEKMHQGDTVWMKWLGGPIVAKSNILSWHNGKFNRGDINQLRELTIGTRLFGLDSYWAHVAQKQEAYFTVIRLTNEEWLEKLIYPEGVRTRNSWIDIKDEKQRKAWLSNYSEPIINRVNQRNLPTSTRFEVFRRDNFTCVYCGRSAPNVVLHVDHKVPWKIVKKHEMSNLFTACQDCNLGKSDKVI